MESETQVKQLIYRSFVDDDTSEADIYRMIRHAQKYNIEHGLSGFLICDSKNFVQLIEGAVSQVNRLFDKIKIDERHHEVEVQYRDMSLSRIMPFLGMGLCLLNCKVDFQQDFYFTRLQAKEFSSLFEGKVGNYFRGFLA